MGTRSVRFIACLLCAALFLMGCPSPRDESKQAEEHVKQAITMAEEAVKWVYPNAIIKTETFSGVSGIQVGPDHGMTDWVRGQYLNGGQEKILINVLTKEIYVTSEFYKIRSYGMKAAKDLYRLDESKMVGSLSVYKEEPYCSEDPDKYGNLEVGGMLLLGTVVNDDFARELLNNKDYTVRYKLVVNEDVDMNIFKETDRSSLGRNVQIKVTQYDNEFFRNYTLGRNADPESHAPIAVYDSET